MRLSSPGSVGKNIASNPAGRKFSIGQYYFLPCIKIGTIFPTILRQTNTWFLSLEPTGSILPKEKIKQYAFEFQFPGEILPNIFQPRQCRMFIIVHSPWLKYLNTVYNIFTYVHINRSIYSKAPWSRKLTFTDP